MLFRRAGEPVRVQGLGARFSMLFGLEDEPHRYADVADIDREREKAFYRAALDRGVYFHYSWHHGFSSQHTRADLDAALERIEDAVRVSRRATGRTRPPDHPSRRGGLRRPNDNELDGRIRARRPSPNAVASALRGTTSSEDTG